MKEDIEERVFLGMLLPVGLQTRDCHKKASLNCSWKNIIKSIYSAQIGC
jgi:hypothetical protein